MSIETTSKEAPEVFDYKDYKIYLAEALAYRRHRERGAQARLAEAIHCQSAYLSMVLKGSAHLSLEQAQGTNVFFGHGELAAHVFLLLVQGARAGTPALRTYFRKQLDA